MLKEEAALLQKHDIELFGKKFRNHIADTIKSKRETREIFTDFPFRGVPHIHRDGVRDKKFFSPRVEDWITENSMMVAASFVNRHKQINKDMVNVHSSSRTFFNMNSVPEKSLKWELKKCSPIDKKVVPLKQSSKRSNSRKTKTFLKGLEKINQGSEYPGFSRWLCNTFSKETFSIKDSVSIGNKSRTTKSDGQGSKGNVEEGVNKTSQYNKGRVLKQFVPCEKEGWGRAKVSNKSDTSKCIYTIQSLQN